MKVRVSRRLYNNLYKKLFYFIFAGLLYFPFLAKANNLYAGNDQVGFDTNDINILLPFYDKKPYPAMSLTTHTNLLSEKIFSEVLKFEYPNRELLSLPYISVQTVTDPSRWFITSFRYDPCGDDLEFSSQSLINEIHVFEVSKSSEKCQDRIRLVVQPLNRFGQPFVTAMHLIYKVNSQSRQPIIEALANIKKATQEIGVDTNGQPLAMHPGLLSEVTNIQKNVQPKVSLQVQKFIEENVKLEELEVVTMILTTSTRHWKLVGGFVRNGTWSRFVSNLNKQSYPRLDLTLGVEEISCNFYDICESKPQREDNQESLLTRIFKKERAQRPDIERQNLETTTLAEIIDSNRTNFFTTNCLSCHQSANYRNRDALNLAITQWPKGITPFSSKKFVGESPSSVINFGYDGLVPRISTRTAAEAAVATDRVNQIINKSNAGYSPSDISLFWNCLMNVNLNCLK